MRVREVQSYLDHLRPVAFPTIRVFCAGPRAMTSTVHSINGGFASVSHTGVVGSVLVCPTFLDEVQRLVDQALTDQTSLEFSSSPSGDSLACPAGFLHIL